MGTCFTQSVIETNRKVYQVWNKLLYAINTLFYMEAFFFFSSGALELCLYGEKLGKKVIKLQTLDANGKGSHTLH